MDLDEENGACLRELLTDTDVAGIAAATLPEASPASAAMVEDFQGSRHSQVAQAYEAYGCDQGGVRVHRWV